MKRTRRRVDPGVVMLAVLALATLALSVAALKSHTGVEASSMRTSAFPSLGAPTTIDRTPSAAASSSPGPTTVGSAARTVVVLGDANSSGNASETWVGIATKQLGWSHVVNLSASGRGYVKSPRPCASAPCANFLGSIDAIVRVHPDLVVTFGGTADGDYDLRPAATRYFADLHRVLPDATLVAVSPVTTRSTIPYYFTLHDRAISAAVQKVGGVFIDVGQPGRGDGEALSASAQSGIAAKIVAGLS